MQSYKNLQSFFQSILERKLELNDKKIVLIGKREAAKAAFEEAVISGDGKDEALQGVNALESQIEALEREIQILENKATTSNKVKELAQAVWNDCHHACQGVRNNYISQSEKTLKAKEIYLRELAILGEIARVSEKYSFYASQASTYLSEHVHVGIGIDEFKEVSLDTDLVKRTYKQGNK